MVASFARPRRAQRPQPPSRPPTRVRHGRRHANIPNTELAHAFHQIGLACRFRGRSTACRRVRRRNGMTMPPPNTSLHMYEADDPNIQYTGRSTSPTRSTRGSRSARRTSARASTAPASPYRRAPLRQVAQLLRRDRRRHGGEEAPPRRRRHHHQVRDRDRPALRRARRHDREADRAERGRRASAASRSPERSTRRRRARRTSCCSSAIRSPPARASRCRTAIRVAAPTSGGSRS